MGSINIKFQPSVNKDPTTDEKFWLVHGIIKAHPLTIGLEQIQNFMRNSQDIVYICFWQFEQIWTDEAHSELIEMLENYLGNWWVLPDENQLNRTLNDIWNQSYLPLDEGRLLIAYVSLGIKFSFKNWFKIHLAFIIFYKMITVDNDTLLKF